MLDTQFIGLNLHFAVNLLAALVCFAVFWLIFDAWTVRKDDRKEIFKWGGFLVLAIGFLLRATSTQAQVGDFSQYVHIISGILRFIGYVGIVAGQLFDPLMEKPVYESEPIAPAPVPSLAPAAPVSKPSPPTLTLPKASPEPSAKPKVESKAPPPKTPKATKLAVKTKSSHGWVLAPIVGMALPIATALACALYWRRATTGLERHLGPVAWGFGALTIFELFENVSNFQGTTNPNLYRLVQAYGLFWWLSLAALLAGAIVLGSWVWRYLTKRLQSQLFIILVAQTLTLFLFSTIGFTFLLLQNIQKQSLADLGTASHVLDYAITSRQAETAAQAEAVASNTAVVNAILARDHKGLTAALADYMPRHGLSTLTITDASAQVLLRGEDPERWGDSRSSDPLVRRAAIGGASSSVVVQSGVVAPTVSLVAASPVRDASGTIVGIVVAGRAISNAFVDGIKASTGLQSAVYGGNVRAATTLVAANGTERAIGIKETSAVVNQQVIKKNQSYNGIVQLQNRPYLAAFAPLKDVNNVTVGMLLVAHPQDELYAAANHSIQLTFLFVVVLVFASVYPVYLISRFLSSQLK